MRFCPPPPTHSLHCVLIYNRPSSDILSLYTCSMHPILLILCVFHHFISNIIPFQVVAYLDMAIISAVCALGQVIWTSLDLMTCPDLYHFTVTNFTLITKYIIIEFISWNALRGVNLQRIRLFEDSLFRDWTRVHISGK